jgi:ATP/ADP translocase
MDLELFMLCEYEKCIKICLAIFLFFLVLFGFIFKCQSSNPDRTCLLTQSDMQFTTGASRD